MQDCECVRFLQWLLPKLQMRWPGFRKVRRQVCRRIERRRIELGLADLSAYRSWIEQNPRELQTLDSFCRITISRFYRDRGVFDHIRKAVLPELAAIASGEGNPGVRCWSAGCASGEEPYTVNMIWKSEIAPRWPDLSFVIVATDADPKMLERAKVGCYPASSLKDLPVKWRHDFFDVTEGGFLLQQDCRTGIEWCQQDIRSQLPDGPFDLILCRHLVFTYYDRSLQTDMLAELVTRLRPRGVIVTGQHETLPDADSQHLGLWEKGGSNGIGIYQLSSG